MLAAMNTRPTDQRPGQGKEVRYTRVTLDDEHGCRELWLSDDVRGVALAMLASVATEVDTEAEGGDK